jgi:hypothetical protein
LRTATGQAAVVDYREPARIVINPLAEAFAALENRLDHIDETPSQMNLLVFFGT